MNQQLWALPINLLAESVAIMRPQGARGNEGLALWFGVMEDTQTVITHVIEVLGPGFHTTPLYMRLSLRAMSSLTDLADQLGISLVGQVHSHPGTFLDLSDLDIKHGIRSPGYLSVVCPYYAQHDLEGLQACGVHVFENNQYHRLSQKEVAKRITTHNKPVTRIQCEVPL